MKLIIKILRYIKCILGYNFDWIRFVLFYKKVSSSNKVFVLNCVPQIGDICYNFSYLGAYRSENKKNVHIIAVEAHKDVFEAFSYLYDEITYLKKKKAYRLISWTRDIRFRGKLNYLQENNVFINPYIFSFCDVVFKGYWSRLNYLEFVKWSYRVKDINASISFPQVPDIKILECYDINVADKIVIFTPYANSMKSNHELCQDIANALSGFKLFTNIYGEELALNNTNKLECTKYELFNICRLPNVCVVGIRSGIMDFIVSSGVKIISLNYNGDFMNIFSLRHWGCNASEYSFTDNDIQQIAVNVVDDIKKFFLGTGD